MFRTFHIASDFSKFNEDVQILKEILNKNHFPKILIDKCIKIFLNRRYTQRINEVGVAKKELFLVLPYLGKSSVALRSQLQSYIHKNISFCKVKVIFKSPIRLNSFFHFKDKIPPCLRSNVVYKFTCGSCNATYYGETCRHLKVRAGEHSGISPLTGKRTNSKISTAVKDHMLICDYKVDFEDFEVLTLCNNAFFLKIKESLLISRDQPVLNRNESSLPLYLFD